jgi:uncharacterized coiled-coil protein SlyX
MQNLKNMMKSLSEQTGTMLNLLTTVLTKLKKHDEKPVRANRNYAKPPHYRAN